MSDHGSEPLSETLQRQRALSRWDNEGGTEADGPQTAPHGVEGRPPFPKMGDVEYEALQSLLHNRLRERREDVFWCVSVLTGLAKHDSIVALPRHGPCDGALWATLSPTTR